MAGNQITKPAPTLEGAVDTQRVEGATRHGIYELALRLTSEQGEGRVCPIPEGLATQDPTLYQLTMYSLGKEVHVGGKSFSKRLTREEQRFAALLEKHMKDGYEFLLIGGGLCSVHGDAVTLAKNGVMQQDGALKLDAIVAKPRTLGYAADAAQKPY